MVAVSRVALFERLLVPLDGTEEAETILAPVADLARAAASEVVLARVVPFIDTLLALPRDLSHDADIFQADMATSWDYVNAVAHRLRAEGVNARGVAALGTPAATILEVGRAEGATLIAMSTHARTGLRRLAFGSVSGKVLRSAGVPLLLSGPRRRESKPPLGWVLLTPEVPRSLEPISGALRQARRLGATLSVVQAREDDELRTAAEGADLALTAAGDPRWIERLLRLLPVPLLILP